MAFILRASSFRRWLAHADDRILFLFLIITTMVAIAFYINYDRMQKNLHDIRAKTYVKTATGIRIEAEEMTLTDVEKNPAGTYIQF